jgi:hypothetical protein
MNGLKTMRHILRAPRVRRNSPNHQCAESFFFRLTRLPVLVFWIDLSSDLVGAIDRAERGVFMHIHSGMFVTTGRIFCRKILQCCRKSDSWAI